MKRATTEREFMINNIEELVEETQAASSDLSINLRNQTVIGKKRDGNERTRRRTVLFIHHADGKLVGKINTRTLGGELEQVRVWFDKNSRAWKPLNERS